MIISLIVLGYGKYVSGALFIIINFNDRQRIITKLIQMIICVQLTKVQGFYVNVHTKAQNRMI